MHLTVQLMPLFCSQGTELIIMNRCAQIGQEFILHEIQLWAKITIWLGRFYLVVVGRMPTIPECRFKCPCGLDLLPTTSRYFTPEESTLHIDTHFTLKMPVIGWLCFWYGYISICINLIQYFTSVALLEQVIRKKYMIQQHRQNTSLNSSDCIHDLCIQSTKYDSVITTKSIHSKDTCFISILIPFNNYVIPLFRLRLLKDE